MTDSTWRTLTDVGLGIELRYPVVSGAGHPVVVRTETSERGRRVHLSAADGSVYVEVVRLFGTTADDEYSTHRPSIEARFGEDAVTDARDAELNGLAARAYAFGGDGIERSVVVLPIDADVCRFITDPRSPVNAAILATVRLLEPPGR